MEIKNEKISVKRFSEILEEKEKLIFDDCIFNGDISLSNISRELEFNNCKFEYKFTISKKKEKITSFIGCTFQELILQDVDIKNTIKFEKCEIEQFLLKNVDFEFIFSFIETKVKNRIELDHVEFSEEAFFNESIIHDKLDFTKTIFYKQKNFYKLKTEVANRETARIIKDSFEQQNNIIEANKFYALEMKEREKELEEEIKKGKSIFEWLVFKIHGLASNHSQDWLLPIFWILNISILIPFFKLVCFEPLEIEMTIFLIMYFYLLIYLVTYSDKYRAITIIISTVLIYMTFYKLSPSINLNSMSSNLNPFSIMIESNGRENKDLDFITLIFKSTIAYLIYQLIISIRQNTRRK